LGVVQERGGEHRACCAASTIPSSNDPHVSRVPKHFFVLRHRRYQLEDAPHNRTAELRGLLRCAFLPDWQCQCCRQGAVRDNKDVPQVPGTGAPPRGAAARRARAILRTCYHSAALLSKFSSSAFSHALPLLNGICNAEPAARGCARTGNTDAIPLFTHAFWSACMLCQVCLTVSVLRLTDRNLPTVNCQAGELPDC